MQKVNLRPLGYELISCSITDLADLAKSLLPRASFFANKTPPNIQRPVNLTDHFGLTFRANLRNIQTIVHIFVFEMDTVENNLTPNHGQTLFQHNISFKHHLDMLQVKFKSLIKIYIIVFFFYTLSGHTCTNY